MSATLLSRPLGEGGVRAAAAEKRASKPGGFAHPNPPGGRGDQRSFSLSPGNPSIVISGAGMVTPLGLTRHQTWRAVLRGQCAMGPLHAMEQPLPAGRDGGQAPELP